jgi:hypothetical protein
MVTLTMEINDTEKELLLLAIESSMLKFFLQGYPNTMYPDIPKEGVAYTCSKNINILGKIKSKILGI